MRRGFRRRERVARRDACDASQPAVAARALAGLFQVVPFGQSPAGGTAAAAAQLSCEQDGGEKGFGVAVAQRHCETAWSSDPAPAPKRRRGRNAARDAAATAGGGFGAGCTAVRALRRPLFESDRVADARLALRPFPGDLRRRRMQSSLGLLLVAALQEGRHHIGDVTEVYENRKNRPYTPRLFKFADEYAAPPLIKLLARDGGCGGETCDNREMTSILEWILTHRRQILAGAGAGGGDDNDSGERLWRSCVQPAIEFLIPSAAEDYQLYRALWDDGMAALRTPQSQGAYRERAGREGEGAAVGSAGNPVSDDSRNFRHLFLSAFCRSRVWLAARRAEQLPGESSEFAPVEAQPEAPLAESLGPSFNEREEESLASLQARFLDRDGFRVFYVVHEVCASPKDAPNGDYMAYQRHILRCLATFSGNVARLTSFVPVVRRAGAGYYRGCVPSLGTVPGTAPFWSAVKHTVQRVPFMCRKALETTSGTLLASASPESYNALLFKARELVGLEFSAIEAALRRSTSPAAVAALRVAWEMTFFAVFVDRSLFAPLPWRLEPRVKAPDYIEKPIRQRFPRENCIYERLRQVREREETRRVAPSRAALTAPATTETTPGRSRKTLPLPERENYAVDPSSHRLPRSALDPPPRFSSIGLPSFEDVASFAGFATHVPARVDAISPRVDAISPRVDAISPRVNAISRRVNAISPRDDAISPRVDATSSRVDAISSRVGAISPQVDAILPRVDAILPRVDALSSRVDAILPRVDATPPLETAGLELHAPVSAVYSAAAGATERRGASARLACKGGSGQGQARARPFDAPRAEPGSASPPLGRESQIAAIEKWLQEGFGGPGLDCAPPPLPWGSRAGALDGWLPD